MQVTPLQFEVHPSSGVPIYRQIMDQVRALVAGGKLAPGDMLPSVRQMGAELGINMMTVSKAYSKLEAEGVVSRSRGQGMVVDRVDVGGTVADRRKELQPFAEQLVVRGIQLSLSDEQMLSVVKNSQRDLRELPAPERKLPRRKLPSMSDAVIHVRDLHKSYGRPCDEGACSTVSISSSAPGWCWDSSAPTARESRP